MVPTSPNDAYRALLHEWSQTAYLFTRDHPTVEPLIDYHKGLRGGEAGLIDSEITVVEVLRLLLRYNGSIHAVVDELKCVEHREIWECLSYYWKYPEKCEVGLQAQGFLA